MLPLVAPGNALVFIDALERWPKDGRLTGNAAALAGAIETAGGEVRGFAAPTMGGMARWIEDRAAERGMRLDRGAAQALAARVGGFVREGDVDRRRQGQLAAQELDKLALYRLDAPVTADDVEALVAEAIPAIDLGPPRRRSPGAGCATRPDLLERVLDATPEPVVLVQLHRRLRELLEVADLVATGTPIRDLPRVLKLHPFRAEQLAKQAAGWTPDELEGALDGLLDLDATVKGAGRAMVGERTAPTRVHALVGDPSGAARGGALRPTGARPGLLLQDEIALDRERAAPRDRDRAGRAGPGRRTAGRSPGRGRPGCRSTGARSCRRAGRLCRSGVTTSLLVQRGHRSRGATSGP